MRLPRTVALTGCAVAVATAAATLAPIASSSAELATNPAPPTSTESMVPMSSNAQEDTELQFKNQSTFQSVFVAQVPDGKHNGAENPPILVRPGETATFGHAAVSQTPEVRLRVYAASQQGLTKRWVKGSLREIVETIHNWPTTGLRVNVYSRSADARETGKSRAMMGDVGDRARLEGNGQVSFVSRQSDDGPARFRVTFEMFNVAQTATPDDIEDFTPHPSP